MAVTDQQFQTHADQNNAEFSRRQILLKGTGVPNQPAPLYAHYVDTDTGIRYEKTGALNTDWTVFESSGGGDTFTKAQIIADGTKASGISRTSNSVYVLANTPTSNTAVAVHLNGMAQFEDATEDYTISGATITFNTALENTDRLVVIYTY